MDGQIQTREQVKSPVRRSKDLAGQEENICKFIPVSDVRLLLGKLRPQACIARTRDLQGMKYVIDSDTIAPTRIFQTFSYATGRTFSNGKCCYAMSHLFNKVRHPNERS